MKSDTLRPPRGKTFLDRFTPLDPVDEEGIRRFADRYGSLVNPLGDSLGLLGREIAEVRDLANTLNEAAGAERRDGPINEVLAALSRLFTLRTYEEVLEEGAFKVAYLRHATLARRVMVSPPFDDGRIVYTYGQRMVPFDPAGAAKFGYREPRQITASPDNRATEALVRFARICVQEAIEQRLSGAHIGIAYDYARRSGTVSLVPATPLGALYLELDRKLRTKPRRRLARLLHPYAWAPCPNWLEPTRSDKVYCSNTCVQRAKRQRQQEAQAA